MKLTHILTHNYILDRYILIDLSWARRHYPYLGPAIVDMFILESLDRRTPIYFLTKAEAADCE